MAGLLDFMGGSIDDPKTAATLALAQGLLGGRGMSGLLNGAQGYVGTMAQAKKEEEARKAEALKRKLLEAQIGETQAQALQRQAEAQKMAEMQKRAQMFQQALAPQGIAPAQAASAPGGPTQANAALIGQRAPTDWAALAQRFPDQIETIKKLAESQDFGRPEVARTVKGLVNGREVEQQFDKFGRPVGQGVEQYRAPIQTDTGGANLFLDPYSLVQMGAFKKTNSPDALLSAGTARRGQDMVDARARERNGIDGQAASKYDPERGLMIDPRTGAAFPVTQNGQPIGPKDKPLNDVQSKALLFGSRMQEADKVIGQMSKQGTNTPGLTRMVGDAMPGWLGGGIVSTLGNGLQTTGEQQVEQAQRDFINAVLRRESGAAIARDEFENARRQYFPEPFDTPEKIAQKARNRDLATRGILAEVPGGRSLGGSGGWSIKPVSP